MDFSLPPRYFGLQAGEGTDEGNAQCMWWHTKLADFFEHTQDLDRKVEVRVNGILVIELPI